VRSGEPRHRGSLVDVQQLERWRMEHAARLPLLRLVAAGLWRAYVCAPEGYREPAWAELGVGRFRAAALLAETFTAIAIEISGSPPDTLPQQIEQLAAIALCEPKVRDP
jgi:hypothetical protein